MRQATFALLLVTITFAFLTPMELGDVWWNLATGKYISEHGSWPTSDPFTITATNTDNTRFALRAFWLFQKAIYSIWSLFDLKGVILAKALLISLAALLAASAHHKPGGSTIAYLAAIPPAFLAIYYDEARPQTASFLFFGLLLWLLERARPTRITAGPGGLCLEDKPHAKWPAYMIPPVMLLWANTHPAYVLGMALITAYLAEHLIMVAFRRQPPQPWLTASLLLGLGVCSLNPNGLAAISAVRSLTATALSSSPSITIHEHLPIMDFAAMTGQPGLLMAAGGALAAAAISAAYLYRNIDILRVALVAGSALLAVGTFRMGMFMALLAAVPLSEALSSIPMPKLPRPAQAIGILIAGALALALLTPRTIIKKPVIEPGLIPAKAAAYVAGSGVPGNVFHPYEWGGYLLWRFGESRKVFIDGRALASFDEFDRLEKASAGYKDLLDTYKINIIMTWPLTPYKGTVPPLLLALMKDPAWKPVHWDTGALVFVRAEHAKKPLNQSTVWELLSSLILNNISREPRNAGHYAALGELLYNRGLLTDARKAFNMALSLDPTNPTATAYMGNEVERQPLGGANPPR